jgi:NADPH2:quinone reductase
MRAAILIQPGAEPEVGSFGEPTVTDGQVPVEVAAAGLNPVDLYLASGNLGPPDTPRVVGQEGVGRLEDGRRVYFNPSVPPYGSWAERTLVEPERVWDVPEELSDGQAVAMGIPALAAWLSLEHHARLVQGEDVLVLGATGVVGQIAVQAASLLGAGHIVGAGRNPDRLEDAARVGADTTVVLGGDDDARALRDAASGDGYDVVIDPVYGAPFEAALAASSTGARLVTIGGSGGQSAEVPFRRLQGRTHIGHANVALPTPVVRDAYEKLTRHAAEGRIGVDVETFSLDRAQDAWRAQEDGPHHKLVVVP